MPVIFSLSVLAASKSQVTASSLGNCISWYTIVLTQRSLDCNATDWSDKGLEHFQWPGNHVKQVSSSMNHLSVLFSENKNTLENLIELCAG